MAKIGKRYTDAERTAILGDMERAGLTQVAAAHEHGISAVTLWQWKRSARTSKRSSREARLVPSNGSIAALMRAEVHARVRDILLGIVADEVTQALGPKR